MSLSLNDASRYAGWSLSLYPDAGEAGGCFVPSRRRHYTGVRGAATDPERARAEAARRAAGRLRRYCAANGLNRFGTLTYGEPRCTDAAELRVHVAEFFRNLRAATGGRPMPYAWVPELHKDDVHWHVHFAVNRWIDRRMIDAAWGRGWTSIKLIGDLPVGSTARDEARVAARYMSKYVAKTFDTALGGRHRYEIGQGFQPAVVRLRGKTAADVLDQAIEHMGGQLPERTWNSDEELEWKAAPAVWFQW